MENILKSKISLVSNDKFWQLKKGTFYFGVDPTGPGLHMGHMLPISLCLNLLELGFKGIILVGGFTGSVGDPTGKLNVRKNLADNDVINYQKGIMGDLKNIFGSSVTFVNNKDWLNKMTVDEIMYFLRHFSVNKKLNLDIFQTRLKNQNPLFMNEFLYPDLQAIDFWYLFKKYGCNIQIGGQDQWGNISYGVHAMNRLGHGEFFGCVTKLLESGGKKIGKTEGNCVFIREHIKIYQQILQMSDKDSDQLCEIFNLCTLNDPIKNKHTLGEFLIRLYYKDDLNKIQEARDFSNSIKNLTPNTKPIELKEGSILQIVKQLNLFDSNTEIKRLFDQHAVYVNKVSVKDKNQLMKLGTYLLSFGKKKHLWVQINKT